MTPKLLEITCFNFGSAIIAEQAGADRIELCANYWEGGITPIHRIIAETRAKIKIPLHVIIRSRGGDFFYSAAEFEQMKQSVIFCKENHIDGIVLGILTEDYEIDIEPCKELIDLAEDMTVTFHRAIDHCPDLDKAFEDIISLGVSRVLTSGGSSSAFEGISQLKRLQANFGKKIIIMPGGGVRSETIEEVMQTGCTEYQSSALTDNTVTVNAGEIKKLKRTLAGH